MQALGPPAPSATVGVNNGLGEILVDMRDVQRAGVDCPRWAETCDCSGGGGACD